MPIKKSDPFVTKKVNEMNLFFHLSGSQQSPLGGQHDGLLSFHHRWPSGQSFSRLSCHAADDVLSPHDGGGPGPAFTPMTNSVFPEFFCFSESRILEISKMYTVKELL